MTIDDKKEKKTNWPAWIQAASGVLIVLITAFYTNYARKQVIEMRKATEEATKGANAAASAARTAELTLKSSDAQFKTNARPYIVKDRMQLFARPSIGEKVKTELIVKNSGRTPAVNIKVWADTLVSKTKKPSSPNEWRKNALQRPGHTGEVGSDMPRHFHISSDNAIDGESLRAVNNRSANIYVYGSIVYEDIFKERHVTDFCGIYKPDETNLVLWTCEEGNSVE